MKTAEEMRARVLAIILDWLTNSNAKDNEQCVMLLNALAGDIQVINVAAYDNYVSGEKK